MPALYFIPHFKEELDRLFPDRRVMMHVTRMMLLPVNSIWGQATRVYDTYLRQHKEVVGVQIRTFHNADGATRQRVLECGVNVSHYLPPLLPASLCRQGGEACRGKAEGRSVGVFVTSLHFHHYAALKDAYDFGRAADGTSMHFYT